MNTIHDLDSLSSPAVGSRTSNEGDVPPLERFIQPQNHRRMMDAEDEHMTGDIEDGDIDDSEGDINDEAGEGGPRSRSRKVTNRVGLGRIPVVAVSRTAEVITGPITTRKGRLSRRSLRDLTTRAQTTRPNLTEVFIATFTAPNHTASTSTSALLTPVIFMYISNNSLTWDPGKVVSITINAVTEAGASVTLGAWTVKLGRKSGIYYRLFGYAIQDLDVWPVLFDSATTPITATVAGLDASYTVHMMIPGHNHPLIDKLRRHN